MILVCEIPPGCKQDEFDPYPGSPAAMAQGCVCPAQKLWPTHLHFADDCPVHTLEVVPVQ